MAKQDSPPVVNPVKKMINKFMITVLYESCADFSRKALLTTLTLENAMAAPAMMGFKMIPVNGYNTPIATGMSTML